MRLRYFVLGLFVALGLGIYAGSNTTSSVSGGVVRTSHVNQYYTALNQDIVPRNSSGVPTNLAGSVGTSALKWLKTYIASGSWSAGDIKMHHTYNGAVSCGQGWMLMDGDIINETNYDAEHSAGDWDIYVITSPLDGKYTPNMTNRYPVGKATTAQTGSIAITAVGNASSQINIAHDHGSHTHTMPLHYHLWMSGSASKMQTFTWTGVTNGAIEFDDRTTVASGDSGLVVTTNCSITGASGCFDPGANESTTSSGLDYGGGNANVTNSTTPTSALSSTQSIQPDSIEVQYCMRIID